MINSFYKGLVIILIALSIYGCDKDVVAEGLRPIYFYYDDYSGLKSSGSLDFGDLGKIVSKGNYLYINERYKGIHVIDNTRPEEPVNKYFWYIPGNREFTIIQNVLYADNGKHLLVIDITNYEDIKLISVLKDQYILNEEQYPENYEGYFECYDPTMGGLAGWEKVKLINPNCKTN